jgi:choline dehydrogenase
MAPKYTPLLSVALALLIFSSRALSLAPRVVSTNSDSELENSYDYVVIGGGTSGLVVANRLTEDPDSR